MSKEIPSENFMPIRVSTLRGDKKIPFNAYIRLGKKHVLYCRMGDSFEGTRLERLISKKLERLYILREEEPAYRRYLTENIDKAYDTGFSQDTKTRAEVVQGHQQANAENLMETPESEIYYRAAKDGTNRYMNFLAEQKQAFQAIMKMANKDNNIAHHGVSVSTIAVGLAKENSFLDDETRDEQMNQMVLGCLIHDIEHQYSKVPLGQPVRDMSTEDRDIYFQHPRQGGERIKVMKHFDQLVSTIIVQHEENIKGSGYPNRLYEKDIDPIVLLVSTANAFDRLVTFEGLSHKDALKNMVVDNIGLYPLNYIKLLQDFLKNNKMV